MEPRPPNRRSHVAGGRERDPDRGDPVSTLLIINLILLLIRAVPVWPYGAGWR
jgi:hypothetical protein